MSNEPRPHLSSWHDPVNPQARAADRTVEIHRGVRLPSTEPGVTLSGDLTLPVGVERAPLLLSVYPYRNDAVGIWDVAQQWFTARGYATLTVEHRGIGASDGVPPPPWGQGEIDDAIAAIDWGTAQPWCDGNVGMWGMSHGGTTCMGVAARRPPQLKAVVPMVNSIDVGNSFLHPYGSRGDWMRLASWGLSQLARQLLPPMRRSTSPVEQARWRRRMHELDPYLVDLAQLTPRDPAFAERSVDIPAIETPSLCFGSWQDLLIDETFRSYEQLRAPKKLIVGPWGHIAPQDAEFEPIILPLALRWFDQWLRGIDTGIMDEPDVRMYSLGARRGWCSLEAWPPKTTDLHLAAARGNVLAAGVEGSAESTEDALGEYRPDPTIGMLAGLRGVMLSDLVGDVDIRDDDMRSLSFTSEPISEDLVICGRPSIELRIADGSTVQRLVVHLADVDPGSRSRLIADGILTPEDPASVHAFELQPAFYRVAAGHRIRLAISDSDFPRLVPLAEPSSFTVTGASLRVPLIDEAAITDIVMAEVVGHRQAPPGQTLPGGSAAKVNRNVRVVLSRDVLNGGAEFLFSNSIVGAATPDGHVLDVSNSARATVTGMDPASVITEGEQRATVRMSTGEVISAVATARCSQHVMWATAMVTVDGMVVMSRRWEEPLSHRRRDR